MNKFAPSLPEYGGPFKVSSFLSEVSLPNDQRKTFAPNEPLRTLKFRIFYPANPSAKSKKHQEYWASDGAKFLKGLSSFVGVSSYLAYSFGTLTVAHTTLPTYLAEPLDHQEKRPLCIFSHGLGGNCSAYSQICGSLASHGFIVCAVEHRDNSAVQSVVRDGDEVIDIEYIRITDASDAAVRKRKAQMAQREYEVFLAVEAMSELNRGDFASKHILSKSPHEHLEAALESFREAMDMDQIAMVGHSFGAATACNAAVEKDLVLSHESVSLPKMFKALIGLDIWMQPLQGVKTETIDMPSLHLISDQFYSWLDNFKQFQSLLSGKHTDREAPKTSQAFKVHNSIHMSQSDYPVMFPVLLRWFYNAKGDPKLQLRLNEQACCTFLKSNGFRIEGSLEPDIFTNPNFMEIQVAEDD